MKKLILISAIALMLASCSKPKTGESDKQFPPISLVNHYEYFSGDHEFQQLGTAFLLKFQNDTFAITTKHTLAVLKTDSLKMLTLDNFIKTWTMSPLDKPEEKVIIDRLLNEDKNESLKSKKMRETDWLIFSIKENRSNVLPLEIRETPLKKGEKMYAVGWTRHMTEGKQRVYEFEYYRQNGNRHFMKMKLIPGLMGGLSGGPVVDENGKLVGMVAGNKFCYMAMQNMFWPVGMDGITAFLTEYQSR